MLNQPQLMTDKNSNIQSDCLQVLIITGYSGAGKNTVMHSLEDIGFFCVNNLPDSLLQPFFESIMQDKMGIMRIALSFDVKSNIAGIMDTLAVLKKRWLFSCKLVFISSSAGVLLKRFQETRRRHPLITEHKDLIEAISCERELLQPVLNTAHLVLDTDHFTSNQLRQFVIKLFSADGKQEMMVTVIAFGFKYGVPCESNLVFDARFLPNPFFKPELKHLRGIDKPVYDYLFGLESVNEYWQRLQSFVAYVINQSLAEGRFSLNIAIGCTGGRHRSVAFVYRLCQQKIDNVTFLARFRDIERDNYD